jgi:methionyl-tRNA formyltransferase
MKKIVFLACQEIGVNCLKKALDKDFEVPLVYTYELILDKTYGYKSVTDFCNKNKINVIPNKQIDNDLINKVKPDLIVSVYYRKILKPRMLDAPTFGIINIHPSLLPYYRGPVPTAWALLNGEKMTGVTIHCLEEGIDTGDIIINKKVPIDNEDTGFTLYKKCMDLGSELFDRVLDYMETGSEFPRKKQSKGGSYYGKISDDMRVINWKTKSEFIINQARAFTKPYIGLESKLLNKRVVLWKAKIVDNDDYIVQQPGRVVDIIDGRFIVSTVNGLILFEEFEFFPPITEGERDIYYRKNNFFG